MKDAGFSSGLPCRWWCVQERKPTHSTPHPCVRLPQARQASPRRFHPLSVMRDQKVTLALALPFQSGLLFHAPALPEKFSRWLRCAQRCPGHEHRIRYSQVSPKRQTRQDAVRCNGSSPLQNPPLCPGCLFQDHSRFPLHAGSYAGLMRHCLLQMLFHCRKAHCIWPIHLVLSKRSRRQVHRNLPSADTPWHIPRLAYCQRRCEGLRTRFGE